MVERKQKWKILRVLTTNKCNYECVYCHNEGQNDNSHCEKISLQQFQRYYKIAKKIGIEEVRFSGGEPLVNSETIEMIEWLNANSDVEIGLATNGSLINEELVKRLSKTRVMITLHFPGVEEKDYFKVTKRDWKNFEKCVELFDKYSIDYSFNYTLYPNTIETLNNVLEYTLKKGKRVKLLPFLDSNFSNCSEKYFSLINQKLKELDGEKIYYEKEGFYLWRFKQGGCVKIINSPCYSKNIFLCKEYGEIRLTPRLELMNCIFGKPVSTNNLTDAELEMLFINLFDNMTDCSKVIDMGENL